MKLFQTLSLNYVIDCAGQTDFLWELKRIADVYIIKRHNINSASRLRQQGSPASLFLLLEGRRDFVIRAAIYSLKLQE